MYLLSPVRRNNLWFKVANISTAQVSAYAEMFGSEYGSPNPSLPVDPTPPVTYILRVDDVDPHRSAASAYCWSPVNTPTSSIDSHERDAVHGVTDGFASARSTGL